MRIDGRDPPGESERSFRRSRIWVTLLVAAVALGLAFASYLSWRIERLEPPAFGGDPWVTILAGEGIADVRDGPSRMARFSDPFGLTVAPDGSIYVADAGRAQRVRRIAPDGTVTTIAGGELGYRDGSMAMARFDTPSGLAIDPRGRVLVADTGNNVIRRIAPDGSVTTVAGDGIPGYRDGAARQARFRGPTGIAVDARGRIIVADTYNDRIRAIHPDGTVSTIAGSATPGLSDGPAATSAFHTPSGVAVDPALNIYVADFGNVAIRKISPDGRVTSVPHHGLVRPTSVVIAPDGGVYAAGDHRVVVVDAHGDVRIVAGSTAGFADGWGADTRFRALAGMVWTPQAELLVADSVNALIRRIRFARSGEPLRTAPSLLKPAFDAGAFGLLPLLWPFAPQVGPFEITATFGEPRGGVEDPRFHSGVDIAAPAGTGVLAVREGVVTHLDGVSAFDTLSEAIRVGPINYVHLRVGRDGDGRPFDDIRFVPTRDATGRLMHMRVRRGARFRTGDRLGTVNAFNHSHLDVGWAGEERNPLQFRLTHFRDTTAPVIARSGVVLFAEDGRPITRTERGRLIVDGKVEVVVDAWDQIDGNAARRRLGLYSLAYQVLHPDESPAPGFQAPRQTMVFDRLPRDAAALLFAPGSGIPAYGNRASRFLYRATNTFRNGVARPGRWDTRTLRPGDYILRMWVVDICGNIATGNRDVAVTIRASDVPAAESLRPEAGEPLGSVITTRAC